MGNITYKSDVGAYSYGYGNGSGAGPHAVTQAGDTSYQYDANGNNVSSSSSDTRTLVYSTFDKVIEINKGGHQVTFAYGPERSRYKRTDFDSSKGQSKTTYYLGSVELIDYSGGSRDGEREYKRQLGNALETLLYRDNQLQSQTTHYLLHDHLGSIDVITDHLGNIVQELSFDAWGQRRSASDWQTVIDAEHKELIKNLSAFSPINNITNRGFTGHEMVDVVGIIHMNGRIYDAKLARFLQADPFIQAPYNTQSLNRYSYVWNNPLNATDPSGYWFLPLLKAAITAFVISDIIVTIGINSGWDQGLITAMTVIANCIASACIGAGEAAKTLALKEVATIAIMGGITSVLQGGKFGHGFVAAGLSTVAGQGMQDLSAPRQFLSRVVIGGTLSEATGGKFANGAASAAFAWVVQAIGTAKPKLEERKLLAALCYSAEECNSYFEADAQEKPFEDYFNEVTGMSVEDSISLYKAQTGESLSVDQVEQMFTDPSYAKEQLMANKNLHKVYRSILNSNVPQTSANASTAGYQKMSFWKSLFHNPIKNSKWIGPSGHMEGVYNSKGNLVNANSVKGTFNFFGPDQAGAHKAADVDPYFKWGN